MQSKAVDRVNLRFTLADKFFEEAARPTRIVAVWSGSDQRQRAAVDREPRGIAAKFDGVFLGGEVAAASPGSTAAAPESDVARISVTGGAASVLYRGAPCGGVAIF